VTATELLSNYQLVRNKMCGSLEAATICLRPCDLDHWPFDLENGVRVTCNVCYLCANFGLPGPKTRTKMFKKTKTI